MTAVNAQLDRSQSPPGLRVTTLIGFLFGRRNAILAATEDRATIWIGVLFVVAATLAREYDAADLSREPWRLALPLAASIVVAGVLYLVIWRSRPHASFGRFLSLFWLTAPLALLYGIPYERFLSSGDAMRANLWTLGIVAAGRIVLMIRIVSVLSGKSAAWATFVVMMVADIVAAIALFVSPMPVIQFMGGVQLTETELLLQHTQTLAQIFVVISLPIWFIGGCIALFRARADWLAGERARGPSRRWPLIAIALACMLPFLIALPATQREQRRASQVDHLLRANKLSEAMSVMSSHDRSDFPPAWQPPPRMGWDQLPQPPLLDVVEWLCEHEAAPWGRAMFLDKFERSYLRRDFLIVYVADTDVFARIRGLLDRLPEGANLKTRYGELIEDNLSSTQPTTVPSTTQSN